MISLRSLFTSEFLIESIVILLMIEKISLEDNEITLSAQPTVLTK